MLQPAAMPKTEELIISSSPHIQTSDSVPKIMLKVLISCVPMIAASVLFFGIRALTMTVLSVLFCAGAEALWCLLAKKPVWGTVKDGSAAVTGVLLAFNLSAAAPVYITIIGAFLAIWLGKQVFGGLGHNPFNPAAVARVALLIALPGAMTTWAPARTMARDLDSYSYVFFNREDNAKIQNTGNVDGISCATPLGIAKTTPKIKGKTPEARQNFKDIDNPGAISQYFFGNRPGCIGEISPFAILIGGFMLLFWKLINWRIPVFFIGTVALITGVTHYFAPGYTPSPLFHVMTGGLLLGAFFMATDMVTSPMTTYGSILFGIGCGAITAAIRLIGNYPEGVSFAILLMNALVPLIDRWCARRPFGYVRKAGGEV